MTASAAAPGASKARPEPVGEPTTGPQPAPPVALYVHVPFCISICPYCDFVVNAGRAARGSESRVPVFIRALRVELELRAAALDERWGASRRPLDSVYLGGGTPSLLAPGAVASLLELIDRRYGIARGAEVTLEANPGPDDRGDLAGFAAAGVSRISFGAQSLDDGALTRLGRRHRAVDVVEAVRLATVAGVRSVNLDLLYDLPGGSLSSWAASLERALALEPDHLSIYALTLDDPEAEGLTGAEGDHLPTSPGARRWRLRARAEQDDERAADQYRLAVERLAAAGFRGYEVSNWARPGHECRHNLVYWQRRPYEAAGPGAHAFDGAQRRWNGARLEGYLAALLPRDGETPILPPGGSEQLDARTAAAEALILSLRLDTGILQEALGSPTTAAALRWGLQAGLLTERPTGRLSLTTAGRLVSNELFARLM